jgi:alditol oxidase
MRILAWSEQERLRNWAGNIEYSATRVQTVTSLQQVQDYVKTQSKLKVLGTRHCFNNIADSKDQFLSLKPMDNVIAIDPTKRTVTVAAGITYGQLCPYLDAKGFALHNLASLPHISVAGACATATHGSGQENGNLATAASGLEIVTADGRVVNLSRERDGETFNGAVVGLGALGVTTKVTLDIQPSFMMRQYVYENLPLSELKDHFDAIESSGYSVSLFTDRQKQRINELWIKSRVGEGQAFHATPDFFGAKLATRNLHPIAALSAEKLRRAAPMKCAPEQASMPIVKSNKKSLAAIVAVGGIWLHQLRMIDYRRGCRPAGDRRRRLCTPRTEVYRDSFGGTEIWRNALVKIQTAPQLHQQPNAQTPPAWL